MPTEPRSSARIRVVLADDHPLLNCGLSRQIEDTPGLDLVGVAQDGEEALRLIRKQAPDVAVLDIDMPLRHGVDVLRAIVDEGLHTRALMLTGSIEERLVVATISAGASGYLVKTTTWPEIMDAIRAVAEGRTVVDPTMSSALTMGLRHQRPEVASRLSEREYTVISLTALSLTALQIANRMHLSDRMVKKHLTSIYDKLGVTSKQEAVAEAMRRGIVR